MSRTTPYLRFWVLMLLLVAVSALLGADPWGPA